MPKCDLFHPDNVLALIQLECHANDVRHLVQLKAQRRSKIRKTNLSLWVKFQLSQRISCSICLENKAGQTSQKQWPWYNQTRSYEWQKKNLKTGSAWFHNFPFVSSSTRKNLKKKMYFLGCRWQIFVAAGRYLLTRLIYSLYRPRLLPRPSLHYGEAVL